MNLRRPGVTYSPCGKQRKNAKTKKQNTKDSRYIYQNELDKACFQHDMVYADFKNLPRKNSF